MVPQAKVGKSKRGRVSRPQKLSEKLKTKLFYSKKMASPVRLVLRLNSSLLRVSAEISSLPYFKDYHPQSTEG